MVNISDIPFYSPGRWLCHAVTVISALTVDNSAKKRSQQTEQT